MHLSDDSRANDAEGANPGANGPGRAGPEGVSHDGSHEHSYELADTPFCSRYFQCATALVMQPPTSRDRLGALRYLESDLERSQGAWECVWEYLTNCTDAAKYDLEVVPHPGTNGEDIPTSRFCEETRSLMARILSRGTEERLSLLANFGPTITPFPTVIQEVFITALGYHRSYAETWLAGIKVESDIVRRACATNLLLVDSHVLSPDEAAQVVTYTLSKLERDVALPNLNVPHSSAREYHPQLLERFVRRNIVPQVLDAVASGEDHSGQFAVSVWRMLALHGFKTHQELAVRIFGKAPSPDLFPTLRELSPDRFHEYGEVIAQMLRQGRQHLPSVTNRLIATVAQCPRNNSVQEQLVKMLPRVGEHTELTAVLTTYFTRGTQEQRAVDRGREILVAPKQSALVRFAGRLGWGRSHPVPAFSAVSFAVSVLDTYEAPDRKSLYCQALAALHPSGKSWLDEDSATVVALALGPDDPCGRNSIRRLSAERLNSYVSCRQVVSPDAFLKFWSAAPIAEALDVMGKILSVVPLSEGADAFAIQLLNNLWRSCSGQPAVRAEILKTIVPDAAIGSSRDMCPQKVRVAFYSCLESTEIPAQSVALLTRRFQTLDRMALTETWHATVFAELNQLGFLLGLKIKL